MHTAYLFTEFRFLFWTVFEILPFTDEKNEEKSEMNLEFFFDFVIVANDLFSDVDFII